MSFSSCRRLPARKRRRTRKYRSENSLELLPVEESACYRCRRPRIGEIEPFRVLRNAVSTVKKSHTPRCLRLGHGGTLTSSDQPGGARVRVLL